MHRPIEYWIALATGVLIVLERSRGRPLISRTLVAAISGGVGYVSAPELADWTGRSETLAVMISTALGYLLIDTAASLLADRERVWSVVKAIIGRGQ